LYDGSIGPREPQRLSEFDVLARDDAGLVGRGRRKRAVIDAHRLEESAAERRSSD